MEGSASPPEVTVELEVPGERGLAGASETAPLGERDSLM